MAHPYGSWPSAISAADVVGADTSRVMPLVDGSDVLWLEARPEDGGRLTLVRGGPGVEPADVSPPGANVRTAYQEYGGGACAARDGLVLLVDFADQRVYAVAGEPGAPARAITPDVDGTVRFSCFRIDHGRGVAYCLREDQRDGSVEPVTSLVRLDLAGPNDDLGVELVAGRRRPRGGPEEAADVDSPPDFVSDPALSPDGRHLAWVSWNHPDMAWDRTWLWVGTLDAEGGLGDVRLLAGTGEESLEQPRWLDDERLVLLSDRTGWSNLYSVDLGGTGDLADLVPLAPEDRDFGQPRWTPDQSSYDVLADGRLVTGRFTDGRCEICVVEPGTGRATAVGSDVTGVFGLRALGEHHAVCTAMFADRPSDVVVVDLRDGTTRSVAGEQLPPDPAWVSRPEAVSWRSDPDLGGDGATAHGFLYPPVNPDVAAPDGELPPLVVTLHGGPTAAAPPAWSRARSFWTSRGFAVLDVNYAGSTGYGRDYRRRLEGRWGVAEVADVASGARHLAAQGRVDGARVAITGGSAGGYTTLAALVFTDVFAAGASHFGVSDLAVLAAETHKLESRYLHRLVAPWPEGRATYDERSPLHHVDRLATPLLLLQGTEDKVVLPNQAELMADAARAKGLPVALVMFEGEGHGFRVPANRARALELELSFYGQVLGFTPADDLPPLEVANL